METIVYFYKARGINEAVLEKMRRKKRDGAYDLIKVALPASLWERRENNVICADGLCERILKLCGDGKTLYACEDCVKELFAGNGFPGGEFSEYRSLSWAEELVTYAGPSDWILIGFMPCIPDLLCGQARNIRSVKWVLSEALYTSKVECFVEDYYVEYGIAIDMQIRKVTDVLTKYYPRSAGPVTVLDCMSKVVLSAAHLEWGSVWLDFDAYEEKRHRIECQNAGISYFSLKKIWV